MAKNQNTFEKRRREIDKRMKAAEKRSKRQNRKDAPPTAGTRPSDFPHEDAPSYPAD